MVEMIATFKSTAMVSDVTFLSHTCPFVVNVLLDLLRQQLKPRIVMTPTSL